MFSILLEAHFVKKNSASRLLEEHSLAKNIFVISFLLLTMLLLLCRCKPAKLYEVSRQNSTKESHLIKLKNSNTLYN